VAAAQATAGSQAQAERDRKASQAIATQGQNLGTSGRQDISRARADMGTNTADYMRKANEAAQSQASQSAQAGATQGARQALMAARSAGLNKGQASMRAGQQAGDAYTNQYQQGLESGRNQYQSGVQQRQALGAQQQGLGIQQQGMGLQGQLSTTAQQYPLAINQANVAQQQGVQSQAAGAGGLGGFLSGIGQLFTSDENCKENIGKSSTLDELVKKVKPVDFNYTKESGEDATKNRVGVLAQDLEKTSMKDNVVDTPEGKKIDAGQQTLSNTNLIVQLAEELFTLKSELKALKGGK